MGGKIDRNLPAGHERQFLLDFRRMTVCADAYALNPSFTSQYETDTSAFLPAPLVPDFESMIIDELSISVS